MPSLPKSISVLSSAFQGSSGFGRVRYAPGGRCGPRVQRQWQLVVIESGSCRLRLGRQAVRLQPRQGVLLAPGCREHFHFDPNQPTVHSWATVDNLGHLTPDRSVCWRVGPVSGRLEELMQMGLRPGSGNARIDRKRLQALAASAIWEFLDAPSGQHAGPIALHRSRRWVEENLPAPISLDGLARVAGVGRTPLRKLFVEAEGISPMRYVRRRRLHHAALLIRTTGMKLAAVAETCGFANEFHLSRLFKAEFGVSPRNWRAAPPDGGEAK